MKARDVEFITRYFEMEHNRQPRGYGSWAFCPASKYNSSDYLKFVTWKSGMYSAVKREAAEHFAFLGISEVVVCS